VLSVVQYRAFNLFCRGWSVQHSLYMHDVCTCNSGKIALAILLLSFLNHCPACTGILLINILFLTFRKQQWSTNCCSCDSLARLRFCFATMDIPSYGRIWNIGNFTGPIYTGIELWSTQFESRL
jgi:hypothetical protein